MDFNTLTIQALNVLANIFGNWGIAIIIFTIIIRFILWPFNVSQQRSMKAMQKLQPKLKSLQERYKSNPEMMQQKMMEFYKENKFNPMAGCLPLLLQLPIFILLYSALMSPQFIALAGDSKFLFVPRLDATIKGNAGVSFDGKFGVDRNARFVTDKTATVYFKNGEILEKVKINQPLKAITVQGEIVPGNDIDFKVSLDSLNLKFAELDAIEKADINVMDSTTKETESLTFTRQGNILAAIEPTMKVENATHYDVVILVALFILTMWLSSKIMMSVNKTTGQDAAQEAMQKSMGTMMPVMIGVTFIFIPIPAGVLLYLITSNIFQIAQTVIINKQIDMEEENKNKPQARVIDAKDIKDVK